MTIPALSEVNCANMALRLIGDDPITALANATRRAEVINEWFNTVRTATLQAHPWREALVMDTLEAYTEPAGTLTPGTGAVTVDTTGVTFTASGTPFLAAHATTPEYRLWGDGVAGKATITGFTSTSVVTATINEAFADLSAIATGSWRLYTGEPDGFTRDWLFIIDQPSASLKIHRIQDIAGGRYARVGSKIYSNLDTLEVEYITDLATTSFGPLLAKAFAYHLAATICEPILKQAGKAEMLWKKYELVLQEARSFTDQEMTPEEFESNDLVDVRMGNLWTGSSLTRDYGAT